ncbi:hypothetical protein ACO0QE_001704 [Hanseniaspora vineae]
MNKATSESILKHMKHTHLSDFFNGSWYGKGPHSDAGGKLMLYVSGAILPLMYFLRRPALDYAYRNPSLMQPNPPARTGNSVIDKTNEVQQNKVKKERRDYYRNLADNDELYVFATNF